MADLPANDEIKIGSKVAIEKKEDQGTGKLTEGIVKAKLTSSKTHPHGIKVELEDGQVGRVKQLLDIGNKIKISKSETFEDGILTEDYAKEGPGEEYVSHVRISVGGEPSSNNSFDNDRPIPKNEDAYTEFKSTFQHDLKEEVLRKSGKIEDADTRKNAQKSIRHNIRKEISLTLAAFANNDGGRLFIGINDDSSILGLDKDLEECGGTVDKLQLTIMDSLKNFLKDNSFLSKLKLEFAASDDKRYLIITAPAATQPIIVHDSNDEEMYVRIQNRSQKFTATEFIKYCKDRFN